MRFFLGLLGLASIVSFSSPAQACSMRYSASVTCGRFQAVASREIDGVFYVGVKSEAAMVQGGFGVDCEWRDGELKPSDEFVSVAALPPSEGRALLQRLARYRDAGVEACVFATSFLDPNYALAEAREGRSTAELRDRGTARFARKIRRQIRN